MKKIFIVLSLFVSNFSFAGSFVCSSTDLYYSMNEMDFGTSPPKGTTTSTHVIVYKGDTLLNYINIMGFIEAPKSVYSIRFLDVSVLSQDGNDVQGSSISQGTLILVKHAGESDSEEITRQKVVCQSTWAMTQ